MNNVRHEAYKEYIRNGLGLIFWQRDFTQINEEHEDTFNAGWNARKKAEYSAEIADFDSEADNNE